MDYHTLLDLATDLGYELAMCGAETFRVEESISRVLMSYGYEAEVFAIPNYLIVSIVGDDGKPITRMRRIGQHGNDLDGVERFSGLSRALCNRKPEPKDGVLWLDHVRKTRRFYGSAIMYSGYFLGAGGYGLFFGGNWIDGICAGLCGILVGFIDRFTANWKANHFFRIIASSFLMALLAYFLGAVGIAPNPNAVTIGALMILVPGLLITNAMRDIIYGDTNSGMNRIIQVFLIAAALALGTGAAWQLSTLLWSTPVSVPDIPYTLLAQTLFALVGCFGFSIQYNIHGPGGLLCCLGGGIAWLTYGLVLQTGASDLAAYFWAALIASVYSETMARIRKCPAIAYLVISIFPMIPGAGVYYTMNHAVQGQMDQFASNGMHTAAIAGVLAVGILLGSTFFRMYSSYKANK